MSDPRGFLKYNRQTPTSRPPQQRIQDYREIYEDFSGERTVEQATRCMDCGIPFNMPITLKPQRGKIEL